MRTTSFPFPAVRAGKPRPPHPILSRHARGSVRRTTQVKAVVLSGAGGNEVVHVEERPDPIPGTTDVVIDVTVAGMNPADLQQREGRYPAPPGVVPDIPGLEVSGTVVAVGAEVTRWRRGDRCFGLVAGGGLASRVLADERTLVPVPAGLDDAAAAAVPEAFITAHDALSTQGELLRGETVLVHGASGAVGGAAAQIAGVLGARVLGVVRSERAADVVSDLGAEPIDAASFDTFAMARTGDRGVDLVIELVGGSNLPRDLAVIAPRGRIVIVAVASGTRSEVDLLRLMTRRATIRGTVLRARPIEEKAHALTRFGDEVVPMLRDGLVRPSIDSVFDVDDVHEAFDRLATSGRSGKVLLRFA